MRIDQFTLKAQEAVQAGQTLARRAGHANYEPEHLLKALLEQSDGVVVPMLQKVGVDLRLLGSRVDEALARQAVIKGGSTSLSNRLVQLLDRAEDAAKALKDDFTSSEHLLLAFTDDKGAAGELLKASVVRCTSARRPCSGSASSGLGWRASSATRASGGPAASSSARWCTWSCSSEY